MVAQISANLPTTFGKEGFGTTAAAVDTITEYTANNGVTVDKALTASAGLTTTTVTASGAISGTSITGSGAVSGTTGTFTGAVSAPSVATPDSFAAVTADGAITIGVANKTYFITKAGVAAMTIVDPTATTHDGVHLTFVATTANAHTLSNAAGSGFFSSGGATKDVATFGGAIGDGISIIAYQGKWYIDPRGATNITLG